MRNIFKTGRLWGDLYKYSVMGNVRSIQGNNYSVIFAIRSVQAPIWLNCHFTLVLNISTDIIIWNSPHSLKDIHGNQLKIWEMSTVTMILHCLLQKFDRGPFPWQLEASCTFLMADTVSWCCVTSSVLYCQLLETQQQVAVAVSTDKRKDIMIEQLDKVSS